MNFWQFLDRRFNQLPGWPDGRGLTAVAIIALTVMILWMMKQDKELMDSDFFKTIATAIILTGLVNSVVAYFFSQNKSSEEAAQALHRRAEEMPTGQPGDPVHTEEETKT